MSVERVCRCGVIIDNPEAEVCYFHEQLALPEAEREIEMVQVMAGGQVFMTYARPKKRAPA